MIIKKNIFKYLNDNLLKNIQKYITIMMQYMMIMIIIIKYYYIFNQQIMLQKLINKYFPKNKITKNDFFLL